MGTNTVGSQNFAQWGVGLRGGLGAAERQLVKATFNAATSLLKLATAQLDNLTKQLGAQGAGGPAGAGGASPTSNASPTGQANGVGHSDSGMFGSCKSLDDVFNMAVGNGPSAPSSGDSGQPAGSLKTDSSGVVTTPGGYKIEATGQFDWKITGPDGKETKVWGDPHVKEGDGGTWDFKRDSTFVLGDGTRINCSTTPYGNGATVTKGLEIISGNDRVEISDIDKGKGKTGQVTQDGFQKVNSFGGKDVFVMGKETDDWSFQGKEVIGSENGGESFKLGNDLAPGAPNAKPETAPTKPNGRLDQILDLFRNLSKVFDSLKNLTKALTERSKQNTGIVPQGQRDPVGHRRGFLERAFGNIGRMLDTVNRFQNLTRSITANRNQFPA
jgi:hypothetical protein